jgi:hypothetical protein
VRGPVVGINPTYFAKLVAVLADRWARFVTRWVARHGRGDVLSVIGAAT